MVQVQSDERLRPRADDVAGKVIDGEAIIMNLSNGMYYSMDGVGATVWELIEQGHTVAQIAAAVAGRYDVVPDTALADVERLAAELVAEELVERVNGVAPAPPEPAAAAVERKPYAAPALQKYSDMADLLALDPPMPGLGKTPWGAQDGG